MRSYMTKEWDERAARRQGCGFQWDNGEQEQTGAKIVSLYVTTREQNKRYTTVSEVGVGVQVQLNDV
jgi:hypothetical protein